MKVGDHIDAMESSRQWYTSTILDISTRKEDDTEYPILYVGFRTYSPDGKREDNNKKKYFGWSETFDVWIPAYSPRIQKLNTFAQEGDD